MNQQLDGVPVFSNEEWTRWKDNQDNIEEMYKNIGYALGIKNCYIEHQFVGSYLVCPDEISPKLHNWIDRNEDAFKLLVDIPINIQHMSFFSPKARYVLVGVSGEFDAGFKTGDDLEEAIRFAICWMASRIGKVLKETGND